MKNLIKFCLVATMIVLPLACDQGSIDTNTGVESFNKSDNTKSSVPILENPGDLIPPILDEGDLVEISGASSTLHRNKIGITVNFSTNGLIPGNAYTLWWVVFPSNPGPPNVLHAAGHIVGASGEGNFSGHLSTGPLDNPDSPPGAVDVFDNPLTAEVHMVLRSHGPAQPGMTSEQILTIDGGCTTTISEDSGPGLIWPDSDVVGRCADIQVAMHK